MTNLKLNNPLAGMTEEVIQAYKIMYDYRFNNAKYPDDVIKKANEVTLSYSKTAKKPFMYGK